MVCICMRMLYITVYIISVYLYLYIYTHIAYIHMDDIQCCISYIYISINQFEIYFISVNQTWVFL